MALPLKHVTAMDDHERAAIGGWATVLRERLGMREG
jgi:hypothetical protein